MGIRWYFRLMNYRLIQIKYAVNLIFWVHFYTFANCAEVSSLRALTPIVRNEIGLRPEISRQPIGSKIFTALTFLYAEARNEPHNIHAFYNMQIKHFLLLPLMLALLCVSAA